MGFVCHGVGSGVGGVFMVDVGVLVGWMVCSW